VFFIVVLGILGDLLFGVGSVEGYEVEAGLSGGFIFVGDDEVGEALDGKREAAGDEEPGLAD